MNKFKKISLLALSVCALNVMNAQEDETQKEIELLKKRIEALENKQKENAALKAEEAAKKEKDKDYDVSFYGFARADYAFDSRRSAMAREYQNNLYPLDVARDVNGKDINATSGTNFLSITSRVGVRFKGPEVWGAKPMGNIEGDFFGNIEAGPARTGNVGSFRLRHAYINLAWPKTSVTLGQTWLPTCLPEVMPGTANFSVGMIYNPFGFVPQIKVRQTLAENLYFETVAYKDREFNNQFENVIPATAQNAASFNSVLPTLHGKLEFKNKNITAGVGAEYRSLRPSLDNGGTTTATKVKSTEHLNSSLFMAYFKYANEKFITKLYGITGGNLTNLVMLGGFASLPSTSNGITTYTFKPTKTSAAWIDVASANPKIAPGVFFGYSKNDGLDDNATATNLIFGRGIGATRTVDDTWRVSGRVDFKQNKFKFSPELEYTSATWADTQLDGTAENHKNTVGNFRILLSALYNF